MKPLTSILSRVRPRACALLRLYNRVQGARVQGKIVESALDHVRPLTQRMVTIMRKTALSCRRLNSLLQDVCGMHGFSLFSLSYPMVGCPALT